MLALKRQHGVTMISLLTGMAISMIGIVSMLSLYKNLIYQTVASAQRSGHDGEIAAGLLTAQIELQGAGYGVATASGAAKSNTDFIVVSGATLDAQLKLHGTALTIGSSAVSGNAIVWGDNPTLSAYRCNALIVSDGGLTLLRATSGCAAATDWASAQWQRRADLVSSGALDQADTTFSVSHGSCAPFGKGLPLPALILTMRAHGVDAGYPTGAALCITNYLT
ncbi:PilW family protein [Solimonas marina]|uniref:Type IV pilus assembly protein PilW n=1 Tax=Solimonas marina TaxID=2714601 RepID=A0A969W5S8_9GAMM|nr:hypothetical protein [Solimonas marina]NKF21176.1 hypothetical protein [Solimonas marina]